MIPATGTHLLTLMKAVHGYFLTAITFHVSLVIGLLCYALADLDQNRLAGLRTPRTLSDRDSWDRANSQIRNVMPIVSALCAIVSLCGIWIDVLRTGLAFVLIIGVQVAALLGFAVAWWSPGPDSLSLLQTDANRKKPSTGYSGSKTCDPPAHGEK